MSAASFKAGGETYTLRFSFGALCRYEDLTDKSMVEGLLEVQAMGDAVRFKPLVPIIQAGLFDTCPDMTPDDVMGLKVDSISTLINAIGAAAAEAFPDEEKPSGNAKGGKKAA